MATFFIHSSILLVYLEAAKQNYEEELFQALLTEQGLGPKQSEMVRMISAFISSCSSFFVTLSL